MTERFANMKRKYTGPQRIIEEELLVKYGKGKTIFIEHMNDLWAAGDLTEGDKIPIWDHLKEYPNNVYVFQSKNPPDPICGDDIRDCDMIGTTIETDTHYPSEMGLAPHPIDRKNTMVKWKEERPEVKRFVTIEPIMLFDQTRLTRIMDEIRPDFINIGADSKGSLHLEPSWESVSSLIKCLEMLGLEVRKKSNLERLKK
jgi:hypothetical protein